MNPNRPHRSKEGLSNPRFHSEICFWDGHHGHSQGTSTGPEVFSWGDYGLITHRQPLNARRLRPRHEPSPRPVQIRHAAADLEPNVASAPVCCSRECRPFRAARSSAHLREPNKSGRP